MRVRGRVRKCKLFPEAFAEAYLALQLTDKDEIVETAITQIDDGFHVKINYVVVESMNL